jgi:large subunit ribosomal protein LX
LSEVRKFKIIGEIRKAKSRIPFAVEYEALRKEHAMQRLYAEMGSRHRARRSEIRVTEIKEVGATAEVKA